jgi:hypothetical protein
MPHASGTRRVPTVLLLALAFALARPTAAIDKPVPPSRELSGHTGPVTSVAVFADGKQAVTGSRDRTVRIWDLANARTVRVLEGHTGPVLAVAVSADGKRVASAGTDHVVRVWDAASGGLIAMLQGHTGDVVGVAFLPDGQLLSGGGDGLRRWDVDKEETVWRTPEIDGGAFDLAVSADGRRAAFLSIASADVDVWDLAARRLVRRLDAKTTYLRPGLAITPDGREVIGRGEENGRLTRWEVDSGNKFPLPDGFSGHRLAFSRDGALAANNGGMNNGAEVWDAKTWRQLASFDGGKAPFDGLLSLAFTPDNKTLLATTGFHLAENVPPHTPQTDKLFVYDLSDLGSMPQTGAKAGKLSWDEIPIRVKTGAGQTVDFTASELRHVRLAPRALDKRLDAFVSGGTYNAGAHFLLHRSAGLLEEVAVEPDARLDDVVWDGKYVWLASRRYGLLLFDRDGKAVDRVAAPAGLLPAAAALKLHPLAPGRVLAVGLDGERREKPDSGWCAVVERDERGAKVNTFFRESQLPPAWTAGRRDTNPAFRPRYVTEPPATTDAAGKAVRSVWVVCGIVPSSETPVLRIDPDTLAVSAYDLEPPNQRPRATILLPDEPMLWVGPREFLFHANYAYRIPVGESLFNGLERKLVVHSPWPNERNDRTPFLRVGDMLYLPGKRWHRIDPRSWAVEDIGPGLSIDGVLAEEEASYFSSGVLGQAAAAVVSKGLLYRFSVDPVHPLAVAATLDRPARGKPLPPEGAVAFAKAQTIFFCGQGAVRFTNGKLVGGGYAVTFPYLNPKADLDAEAARADAIRLRAARRVGGDRERVGLSDDQVRRLAAFRGRQGGPPLPSAAQVEPLFAKWEATPPGPARDEAAKPLFAAARAAGEADAWGKREFIAGLHEIVTPRQWKLLNYEIPTDADK